jgi:hypothetical protein
MGDAVIELRKKSVTVNGRAVINSVFPASAVRVGPDISIST